MTLPPLDSEALNGLRALVADDGYAATFQTMGQYRTALLRAVDSVRALPRSPLPEIALEQKCPVCDGTGLVSRPHGIAGDVTTWMASSTAAFMCRRCEGIGTISVGPRSPLPTEPSATLREAVHLLDHALGGRDYADDPKMWEGIWSAVVRARDMLRAAYQLEER